MRSVFKKIAAQTFLTLCTNASLRQFDVKVSATEISSGQYNF